MAISGRIWNQSDPFSQYPKWLSDNNGKVPKQQFDSYAKQFDIVTKLCDEYQSEKPEDSQRVKDERFERILDLMTQVNYSYILMRCSYACQTRYYALHCRRVAVCAVCQSFISDMLSSCALWKDKFSNKQNKTL